MELKEGMYVRTKEGLIDKVIIDYKGCCNCINCNCINCNCKHVSCEHNYYDEKDIIKSSDNLIDLIEVGDYVNGYLVKDIDYAFDDVVMNNKNARRVPYIDCDKNNYIDDIKSIVTKEQFAFVKYEVKYEEV